MWEALIIPYPADKRSFINICAGGAADKEIIMAFFSKLKESLSKTKTSINEKIENVMKTFQKVDDELFDELEEALITADLGVNTSMK